jgi:hypothetical protein
MMTIPPVRTPRNLFTHEITITNYAWGQDAGGQAKRGSATGTAVVQAAVQPTSAQDALLYGRDTTKQIFDVFADPVTTAGVAWTVSQADTVTFSGQVYRVLGTFQDFCSMGVLRKFVIERET